MSISLFKVKDWILFVISFLGCILNLFTLIVVLIKSSLRTFVKPFLMSLLVNDFLTLSIAAAEVTIIPFIKLGQEIQDLIGFSSILAGICSTYFVVLISLERFLVVCFPLHVRSWITIKRELITSIVTTLVLFLLLLTSIILQKNLAYFDRRGYFNVGKIYFDYQAVGEPLIHTIIPYFIIIFCNCAISIQICRNQAFRKISTHSSTRQSVSIQSEIALTKILFVIIFVFGICRIPSFARQIVTLILHFYPPKNYGYLFDWHDIFADWEHFFTRTGSALNFFIFFAFSLKFRKSLLDIFCKSL